MNHDAPRGEAELLDEQLVAYLDRELPDAESEEIERRLATDPVLRDRISGLDRIWNALDVAPRATTDRVFAETTVEVVVEQAEATARRARAAESRSGLRWLVVAAAGAVAVAIGFVGYRIAESGGDRQMLFNLPAIQYAAVLGQAGEKGYLERLASEAPGVIESVESLGLREEASEWDRLARLSPPARGRWFSSLSDEDRDAIIDQTIAFRAQSSARTERLIKLDREIHAADDAGRLRLAALAQHALLSTLPEGDRSAFLSQSADARLAVLRRNETRWSQRALMRLSDEESEAFRDAVERLAAGDSIDDALDRAVRLLEGIRPRRRDSESSSERLLRSRIDRGIDNRIEHLRQHPERVLLMAAWTQSSGQRRGGMPGVRGLDELWDDWETQLTAALPPRAQGVLRAETSPSKRARLLFEQLERVASPARSGQESRYFAEDLSNEELDSYLAMPVSEMQDRLRERMAEESFGQPRSGGNFGGRRGGPRGGDPGFGPERRPLGPFSPSPGRPPARPRGVPASDPAGGGPSRGQ